MNKPLKVLIVEDAEDDTKLALLALRRGGFEPTYRRVQTAAEMEAALTQESWDAVISDFNMPGFTGLDALSLLRASGRDIPFILISGVIGEEAAVEAMKAGAHDYVMKKSLARLAPALERELKETHLREVARQAQHNLIESEAEFRTLSYSQTAILNTLPAHIALLDGQGVITTVNEAWRQFAVSNVLQSPGHGVGVNYLDICDSASGVDAAEAQPVAAGIRSVLGGGVKNFSIEYPCHSPTEQRWFLLTVTPMADARRNGAVVMHLNITKGKQAEEKILQLNRVHAMRSGITTLIVHVLDRDEIYREACRIAVEAGGFRMAWIGIVDRSAMKIVPAASAGADEEILSTIKNHFSLIEGAPLGNTMAARAVRGKTAIVSNDLQSNATAVFRNKYVESGIHSMAIFPMIVADEAVGMLALYADESEFFREEEMKLLTNLAGDISFALEHIGKEEKIVRLSRIHALLSGINAAILRVRDSQTLFNEACRIAVEHGHLGLAWIGTLDPVTQDVTPVAWAGERAAELTKVKSSARADLPQGMGAPGRAIRGRCPVFNNDLTQLTSGGPRLREILKLGYRSQLALPLFEEQTVVGVLTLYAPEPNYFVEQERALLAELAANISFALAHISKEEKIARLSRIQALNSGINAVIVHVSDRQHLFSEVCRIAVETGGFGIAWIGLLDQTTLDVIPAACAGVDANSFIATSLNSASTNTALGKGLVGQAIRAKRPVFSNDIAADPGKGGARREEAMRRGYHSVIALPLVVADKAVGILALFAKEPHFFTDEEVGLLSELAGNVSFALDLIQKSAALADSEAKLNSILSTLQEVVWSMCPQSGRILYVNAAAEHLTHRAVGEFLAQRRLWRHLVHRDDRASLRGATTRLLQDGTLDNEFRIVLAGGEIRTVESTARAQFDASGQAIRIDGTLSDITGRKLAEAAIRMAAQRLEIALEGSQISVWVSHLRTNEVWLDATWATFLGKSPAETRTTAAALLMQVHPDDRQRITHAAVQVMKGEIVNYTIEHRVIAESGEWKWILSRGRVIERDANGPLRMSGTNADITERKRAETALYQLNEELEDKVVARTVDLQRARHEAEAASRAKSSFLAAMSHEIRTPMNGVIGMIDVLHQSSLKGDQVEMVQLIRDSAFSLLGIINDILDFSKIEAGKLELEHEVFAIADVVEGVCGILNDIAQKQAVVLTLYSDPAIPASVLGDALRLRQVLINLVNNAIKFSSGKSNAGRVSVRALLVEQGAQQDPQQVKVEFQIIDNGIGMDDKTLARLFSAFTQADTSTTRRYGGTGLGLVIANNLVEMMGGEITVQSAPDKGATFKACLPFAPLPANTSAVEAASDVSGVSGLSCVVVGAAGGLADDLAVYLGHANAMVERVRDLAGAKLQSTNHDGLSVWVVDNDGERQPLEQIRAAVRARIDQAVRVAIVLIERGKRHRPRVVAPDMIAVDGNVLKRRTFLKAVAAAAGRASLEPEADEPTSSKLAMTAPTRTTALRQGRLILVAEDNETNQKVILRQLALLGCTADIAGDGLEARHLWRSGDYALLLTDLHMPKMDGYELTQAIRAEEKGGGRLPIIALTANALKGEADHCRAVGMDDYRSKPTPLAELKAVLDHWLPAAPPDWDAAPSVALPTAVLEHAATAVPVDVSVLKALVGDDPDMISELLQDFRNSAIAIAVELCAACATGQIKAAEAAAHKLKSAARAVGAMALGALCEAMEKAGMAGDKDALTLLLPRFEAEMILVQDYLNGVINSN